MDLATSIRAWLSVPNIGQCFVCQQPVSQHQALCAACWQLHMQSTPRCERCAIALNENAFSICADCLRQPPKQTLCIAAVDYTPLHGEILRQLKYRHRLFAARDISMLLARTLGIYYQSQPMPQLILPVPLHVSKLNQRGFNQSALLAKHLAVFFQLELALHYVTRQKRTKALEGLAKAERKRVMRAAFSAKKLPATIRHIALVDDVYTSGATIDACITALKKCNPELRIDVWVYARTPKGKFKA